MEPRGTPRRLPRVAGFAQVLQPDHILRETRLDSGLEFLGREIGRVVPPERSVPSETPFTLADIHDDDVEAAVRAAYQRDYMQFGFGDWVHEQSA